MLIDQTGFRGIMGSNTSAYYPNKGSNRKHALPNSKLSAVDIFLYRLISSLYDLKVCVTGGGFETLSSSTAACYCRH